MKKLTKWLALLMAGLMVSAALFACDTGYDWAEDEDEEDKEESESFDEYKNLDPDEVWDALMEAKDYTISIHINRTYEGDFTERTMTVEKDGNKVKLFVSANSPDGESYEELGYCDLDKHLFYEQSGDEWDVDENENVTLETLLNDELDAEILFTEGLYGEYDKETRSYPMIPEKLIEAISGNNDMTASGSMTRKGTAYTFLIQLENENQKQTVEFVFTFESVKVDLPKVETPEGDENQPENKPLPEVSQKPDEPDVSVPTPEVPEPDYNPYSTVSEILAYQDSCFFSIASNVYDNGYDYLIDVQKDDNIVLVAVEKPEESHAFWIDLDRQIVYTIEEYKGREYWVYEELEESLTWDDLVIQILGYDYSPLFRSYNYSWEYDGDYHWFVEDFAMEELSESMGTSVYDVYLNGDYPMDLVDRYEWGEYYFEILHQYNLYDYRSTILQFDFSDFDVDIDDNALSKEEFDEMVKQETKPEFDQTPYLYLPLDQLYDALLTTEELYILWEQNRDQVVIEKSGDVIEIGYYDSVSQTAQWYYIDFVNQIRYVESKGYATEVYTQTWEELLLTLGIVRDAFFLQEETYLPFDESSQILEVNPDALDHSFRSATFMRYGYEYRYEEQTTASRYLKIVMSFKDTNTKLPI